MGNLRYGRLESLRYGAVIGLAIRAAFALVCGSSSFSPALHAGIPEPGTLFYGRLINRTSGQVYLHTNGTLAWTIQRASGGAPTTFTTQLAPLAEGRLSYRLTLPHEALASGVTVAGNVVPLEPASAEYRHWTITLDGQPVRLLPPAGEWFQAGQPHRAAAYRVDLETTTGLPDSDGDGLPDWWEDRFGLDKFLAGDASLDADGDGASNRDEFENESDPTTANHVPTLATARIIATEGGTVGVRLHVLDSDSSPDQLHFTLRRVPAGGELRLQPGGTDPARVLTASDTFTQADVVAGRLVFRHTDATVALTSFEVTVNDEAPAHPTATGTVAVVVYRPSATDRSGARLWLDAREAAAQSAGAARWRDRSGHSFLATGTNTDFVGTNAPGGHPSLRFAGEAWGLSATNAADAFTATNRTVITVFKATGATRQQVFSSGLFELGITAADDLLRPDRLRYGTATRALCSRLAIRDQWAVATVWDQGTRAALELNGCWAAEGEFRPETTSLGLLPTLGGKTTGTFDPVLRVWQFGTVEPLTGELAELLAFERVLSADERQRINHHLLSKWLGHILWDGSDEARPLTLRAPSAGLTVAAYQSEFIPQHGRDHSHILAGGAGPDTLAGGMEDDQLRGGPGDDVLTGGGGADVFAFNPGDGNDTILDFAPGEGDALDLSGLLNGASRNLEDYVQLSTVGTNSWLRVNPSGTGGTFTNVELTLANTTLRQSELAFLWANGHVISGSIGLDGPAWVSVAATRPNAAEEGPVAGRFTLSRSGSTEAALTVNLTLGGTAVNGGDYSLIGSALTFAPGQSAISLDVQPYPDSLTEAPEVVELVVLAGTGYSVGATDRAHVVIADLPERISIEVLEPLASRIGPVPGLFLITRSGVTDRSTVVRLALGGTAVNGLDYQRISTAVVLNVGQSALTIPLTPIATRPALASPKSVDVSILPDPNGVYATGTAAAAHAWLVEELMDFALWREQWAPGMGTDLAAWAGQDVDGDGLLNVIEYAFGLNPGLAEGTEGRLLLPRVGLRDGHLTVEFRRRLAALDLDYVVEVSDDLRTWFAGSPHVEEVTGPEFAGQPDLVCLRDRTAMHAAGQRFIRVRVVWR